MTDNNAPPPVAFPTGATCMRILLDTIMTFGAQTGDAAAEAVAPPLFRDPAVNDVDDTVASACEAKVMRDH